MSIRTLPTASHRLPAALATEPEMLRAVKSRGSRGSVDRTGGRYGAGLIDRVSVITAGEASGHDAWIDKTFIAQVKAAMLEADAGVKSRFTHPDMSSDGMGKMTSRLFEPALSADGRQLYANQHFLQSAHSAPDGDLAGYLMDLAEEDPASYGLSIVFKRDVLAMEAFSLEHRDARGGFKSPDPGNVHNYEHLRLHSLHAADAVDEPAANPNGLFHRQHTIAAEAEAVAAFALGLSNDRPEVVRLGLNPDRVRAFAVRFLSTHNLELRTKSVSTLVEGATGVNTHAEAARFKSSFGEQGAVWYAQGLTFEQCQAKQRESLGDRLAALEAQLNVGAKVEGRDENGSRKGFANKLRMPGEAKGTGNSEGVSLEEGQAKQSEELRARHERRTARLAALETRLSSRARGNSETAPDNFTAGDEGSTRGFAAKLVFPDERRTGRPAFDGDAEPAGLAATDEAPARGFAAKLVFPDERRKARAAIDGERA